MSIMNNREFDNFTDFVRVNYGLNLVSRRSFVETRLAKLMAAAHFTSFTDYFNYICSDKTGTAISNVINSLTINYTLFYREGAHFEYLRDVALPKIYAKIQDKKDFRIWSAGCATGEEPYTIAMVLTDFLGVNKPQWDMQILATDISENALRRAIAASYPVDAIETISHAWAKNNFVRDPENPDNVIVSQKIRDEVIFRKLNLIGDSFNFKNKFHIIFCRNVMIYFDEPTKDRLLQKLYDILDDGGYLFIGLSETINRDAAPFKYVMPSVFLKET